MAGKGSKPRPIEVTRDQFESNWDRIFSKKNAETWTHICKHIGETVLNKSISCSFCGESEDE